MEQQPHIETPHFISPEEREHIDFYQEWIRVAFVEGLVGMDELTALRERFFLSESDERLLEYREVDLEPFRAAALEIQAQIDEELHYAAQDLRRNIFQSGLFKVGIVIGDEVKLVEGITTKGESVLPIIDGEPYDGDIDDVLFDR